MDYNIEFEITSDTTCRLVRVKDEYEEVIIPEEAEIDGKKYKVTRIDQPGFFSNKKLVSVVIPDTVTEIGYAFYTCTSLTSVKLPKALTHIEDYAFYYCSSLEKIELPDSVSFIGKHAFEGCKSLKQINVPKSLKTIEYKAFTNCDSLNSFTLPDTVSEIGGEAFSGCNLPEGVLCYANNTKCYGWVGDKNKCPNAITIPNTVTYIGPYAFYFCSSLTSIALPDSVTYIGESAFDMSGLSSISIPDSVAEIGISAFKDTPLEIGMLLYNNNTKCYGWVGNKENCPESIIIPDSVTHINPNAFAFCKKLTNVTLPQSVKVIGEGAFMYCYALVQFNLPKSLERIGDRAFAECTELRMSLKELNFPEGMTYLGRSAFSAYKKLRKVVFPKSMRTIGEKALYECRALKKVIMPEGVETIENEAFRNCSHLESIEIPNTVTSMGDDVFKNCVKLEEIRLPDMVIDRMLGKCAYIESAEHMRLTELGKFAAKAVLDSIKKAPGCKYLKVTNMGEKCCEISLVYQKVTAWKSIFRTDDLANKAEELKAVAANYEQLYNEALKTLSDE